MKKTLSAILLFIMVIVMAVVATGCIDEDNSSPASDNSSPSQSTGGDSSSGGDQEEKKDAAAVTDLSVSAKAVATFTALDGFEYQFVIDGTEVDVEEMNGRYDVSEFVSSASKTHTVAVYSKENDEYNKSELSNVVKVKAIDTDNVNFSIGADKKVSFNAVDGYEYYISVNGIETKVTPNQDVSALLARVENTSAVVKLIIKGSASDDTVILDTIAKEVISITWHKAITDFAYENGAVTFASELNYTYDLYANGEVLKANVKSGDNISDLIVGNTVKQLTLFIKVKENAEKSSFVSVSNEKSNEVILNFLSAPEVSATVNNGVITLVITDTENVDVNGITYELFIDDESVGTVTNGQNISALFAKKGDATLSLKAMADGYIASQKGNESTVNVPDYNRFHFVADNKDNAEIDGIYGEKATVKALQEGVVVSSDISVDLTKANKKSAIIVINNPSDHPAGIDKMTIDIVSATNADKFIRIVASSGSNGYNAHIYGGFGSEFAGSLRSSFGIIDATWGQIIDYNILWTALGLGSVQGDWGYDGWEVSQKRQLTIVYDDGKIGYYSPACKFVPIMDLSKVNGFAASDFANAKINFTFDNLISNEKAGYANTTHAVEIYGNGVDYTDEFMIDKEGFSISALKVLKNSSGYIGIYLNVIPVGQDDIPADPNEWVVMGGTYSGNVTLNGVANSDLLLKITGKNSLFLTTETSELNALFANAAYFEAPLYIEIPADSTFTYNGKQWTTRDKIGICTYYENGEMKWQVCTHDSHEYSDDIAVTLNGDVKRMNWYAFDVELKNIAGNHIDLSTSGQELGITVNGTVLLNDKEMDPWFVTSDWNGYLLIKTSDGKVFADKNAFDAAKAAGTVYKLTIKAGTVLTFNGKNYVIAEDMTYKLSLKNDEYSWREDNGEEDPTYTLDGEVKRSNWWQFEMHLKDSKGQDVALPKDKAVTVKGTVLLNGQAMDPWFVTSDWDGGSTGNYLLAIKTSDGKVFADKDAFDAAKAAGTVYTITVKAGTILTIEGKDYVIIEDVTYKLSLENDEYSWREDNGEEDLTYTLDGEVKRSNWWQFEMHLKDSKGQDVALPKDKAVTVKGTVLLNGQAMDPWFVTSDWDGGSTGNYLLAIKTSDGKVFADKDAFDAAKAAGTVYTITVKAGTTITIEGVEYTISNDITYKLSLINDEYTWREAENLAED